MAAAAPPQVPSVRSFRVQDRVPVLVDLLAAASDIDGDPLSCLTPDTSSSGVPLVVVAPCVLEYNWPSSPSVVYDEITYQIRDASGATTGVARITLSHGFFAPLAPANPAGLGAVALSSTSIALSWYDQADNETYYRVSGRTAGGNFEVLADELAINSEEFLHGTAPGQTWDFFVEACNAFGCRASPQASATTPAPSGNQPPVARPDSGSDLTVAIGGSLTFPKSRLLVNDSDPDLLDALAVVSPTGAVTSSRGELREVTPGPGGWYVYRHTGTTTGSDSFTYAVSDGEATATSTVTFTITGATAPVAASADNFSTPEGVPLYIRFSDLLANDSGSSLNVSLLGFSKPTQGRLDFCCHDQVPGPPEGVWFLPDNNNLTNASFHYTITGAGGSSSSAEVTVTISNNGVSPDPTQTFANKTVTQMLVNGDGDITPGQSAAMVLTFSDLKRGWAFGSPPQMVVDLGDLLQFRLFEIQETGIGDVSQWITPYVPYTPGSTLPTWSPKDYEGAFVFTRSIPDSGVCTNGCSSNTISYRLRGADGAASAWTPFRIEFRKPHVAGIPFAALPDFGPSLRVPEGELLEIPISELLRNDVYDSSGGFNPFNNSLLGRPVRGSFEGNPIAAWTVLRYRAPTTYRGVDHFSYSISPAGCAGAAHEWACSSMARVVIEILPGAPVAQPDAVSVPFETAVRFAPSSNDTDPQPGQTLKVVAVNIPPQHGSASLEPSGTVVYTPSRGYSGVDTLRYRVEDPWGNQATADVTLTVAPRPNQPPEAVDDAVQVEGGSASFSLDIDVLANDRDIDPGDSLSVTDVQWSSRGVQISLNTDGTLRYQASQPIPDTFTYTLSDNHGATSQGTVTITVLPCPVCL